MLSGYPTATPTYSRVVALTRVVYHCRHTRGVRAEAARSVLLYCWPVLEFLIHIFVGSIDLLANHLTSVPHPSENHIHIRIQMYDNLSSLTALLTALSDLDDLCVTIDEAYKTSFQKDDFERWDEKS